MRPKNKLVTVDGEPIIVNNLYAHCSLGVWSTYLMTAEIYRRAVGSREYVEEELDNFDGHFLTIERKYKGLDGYQVWFSFDDGKLLDQTSLKSVDHEELRMEYLAREYDIFIEQAYDRFYRF
jgi:hypothetical protein